MNRGARMVDDDDDDEDANNYVDDYDDDNNDVGNLKTVSGEVMSRETCNWGLQIQSRFS